MKQPYTVVVAFTGECCSFPHLWVQGGLYRSPSEAARSVLRKFRSIEGEQAYEYIVFPGVIPGKWQVKNV